MSGDPIVLVAFFQGIFEMMTYFFIGYLVIRLIAVFLIPKAQRKRNLISQ